MWLNGLRLHRRTLDLSSIQLDGSHTLAKNGRATVGYQGCKKARATTALFLADNQDQPLACATPQAGNHHDSFQLAALFEELCVLLEAVGIAVAGLFLNADSVLDTNELCQVCATRYIEANIACNRRATDWQTDDTFFDPERYRRCAVVEHANVWLDSLKMLLVRHETSIGNWLAFHWFAFVVLFWRKTKAKSIF